MGNADLRSLDERRRIVSILAASNGLEIRAIAQMAQLSEIQAERLLIEMASDYPPMINRVGESRLYRLSTDGRKAYGIKEATEKPISSTESAFNLSPGPRGQLVKILKHKPTSKLELCRKTGLAPTQVNYFLRTLADRGLIADPLRSQADGRVVLHRLKTTPVEPPKPLLTASIIPLTDPTDWHFWLDRLLLEKEGVGKVDVEDGEESSECAKASDKNTANLKRVLVVGTKMYWRPILQMHFAGRLRLSFFDNPKGSAGLFKVARAADHVFLNIMKARHSHEWTIRGVETPVTRVRGSLTQLQRAIERYCES